MCRFIKQFFRSKKEIEDADLRLRKMENTNETEDNYNLANLKEIAEMKNPQSFRNSFSSETDLIQHFFKEFNNWVNNHINLQFSKYYVENYEDLIQKDIADLEEKELEVFRYQQIVDKSMKDKGIREATFELFTGAISMSDFSKKTLKVLKIEMDAVKGSETEEYKIIEEVKSRINSLMLKYNTDYDKYFKNLTAIRLRFLKAIESYLNRIKSIKEN